MRRIDRIFSALSDSNNICEENNNNADMGFAIQSVLSMACNETQSEVSLETGKCLTEPIVMAEAYCGKQDKFLLNNDIDSPMAPLFSPLTPLIAKKKTDDCFESKKENSSPVRPMSPDTLALYHTLKAFEDDDFLYVNEEHAQEVINVAQIDQNLIGALENDDELFVHRNEEHVQEVLSVAQNSKEVFCDNNYESENRNEELAREVTDTAHDSKRTVVENYNKFEDGKEDHANKVTCTIQILKNAENNDESRNKKDNSAQETTGTVNTLREALENDNNFKTRNEEQGQKVTDSENFNKHKPYQDSSESICDFSSDTDSDYVPPELKRYYSSSSDENVSVMPGQETENDNERNTPILHEKEGDNNKGHNRRKITISDDEIHSDLNIETVVNDNSEKEVGLDVHDEGRPKKGRKRKHESNTLAQIKERKYANLPYHGRKKYVESKVFRDYTCTCNKLCHQLVPKEQRQEEFQKFVTLGSYEAQLLYIRNCVTERPKARAYTVLKGNKSGKKRPREYARKYTICDIEVCRDMFINNFQITPKKIDITLRKTRSGKSLKDQRGISQGGWNKTSEEDVEFIKNIINDIPKYQSHYRREQTGGGQYLKVGTTVQIIYNLYVEKLKDTYGDNKKPVSFATLNRIFTKNFNLRCKTLKKDTCSRCDTLTNKIRNSTAHDEQLKILKEDKENHLKRAENLRKCMNDDLKRAKTDESFECLTFDLEKTLPLPRIPTSIVFYKRQLWLYNCGIHAGSNDSGHCYLWIEGEAGRGAQEVGSCLINYIKNKLDPKVKHLALWSDCCGGQNRNIKIVLMLKVTLKSHETLKTITLNYLESGHTFLPNDTDFSKIETHLKFHERIYSADEYINVIKSCKKKNPLQVYKMKKEDFLGTEKIEKKIVNRKTYVNKTKTNWLKTKQIMLKKEDVYAIFMKTNMEDEFQELNIEKKIKKKSIEISENDLSLLWPNGKEIPQAKLDDLKSMFDLIPKDCLGFYKSLKGNRDLVDDLEGFGGPLDFNIDMIEDELDNNVPEANN